MRLLKHIPPRLKLPEFEVDEPLSKYLNDDPLLKHMNKSFNCALIGKGGSGKTSLVIGLINTPKKLKKVFHKIYVFMPASSQASMKKNIFDELPQEQKFEGVDFENLSQIYNTLLDNTENKKNSLLIFDDVQSYLKNKETEKALGHIINNRRHLRASIFIIAQNYLRIPADIRKVFTDIFCFNISKKEWEKIYEESLTMSKKDFYSILNTYKHINNKEPKSFVYFHYETEKAFINWNEIVDEDENNDIQEV